MAEGFDRDPHSQDGQACPRNRFGLRNYAELTKLERIYAEQRLIELESAAVSGDFDRKKLCLLHAYIFQDVFPWAGQLRVVGLSKPGGAPFAAPQFIATALDSLFATLHAERLQHELNADQFAERAGFYLGEINAIHPFREGNGRTQREFIRQVAAKAGHTLSWAGFTQEQMVRASILSHTRGDHRELASIIKAAIVPEDALGREMPSSGQDA